MTNRTSNRICIALALATALLIGYALACTAETIDLELPDGNTLRLRAEEVDGRLVPMFLGELPNVLPEDPGHAAHEDRLAYFASRGNETWRRVRATQQARGWQWVQGYIVPAAARIHWGRDQRVVMWVTGDTASVAVECVEVLAFSSGEQFEALEMVQLYPGGWRGFPDQITVWYDGVGNRAYARCDVVVAFPASRRWTVEAVVQVTVTEGGT